MSSISSREVSQIISSCKIHTALEALRRLIIIIGLFLAAAFATWTDFHPYFVVSAPSKDELKACAPSARHDSAPEARSENSLLSSEDSERSNEHLPLVTVNETEWQDWFRKASSIISTGEVPANWLFRLSADDVRDVQRFKAGKTSFRPDVRRIHFAENEAPLSRLFVGKKPGQELIVALDKAGAPGQFLKVYYATAPYLSGLGSTGIYGVPDSFTYPCVTSGTGR